MKYYFLKYINKKNILIDKYNINLKWYIISKSNKFITINQLNTIYKYLILLNINYKSYICNKSKCFSKTYESRMGKGKGNNIKTYLYYIYKNKIILKLFNISLYKVLKYVYILNSKLSIKLKILKLKNDY